MKQLQQNSQAKIKKTHIILHSKCKHITHILILTDYRILVHVMINMIIISSGCGNPIISSLHIVCMCMCVCVCVCSPMMPYSVILKGVLKQVRLIFNVNLYLRGNQ